MNCAKSFKYNVEELIDTLIQDPNVKLSELEINCLPFYGFVSQTLCGYLSSFRLSLNEELNSFYEVLDQNLDLKGVQLQNFSATVSTKGFGNSKSS